MTVLRIFVSYEATDTAFATQLMTDLQNADAEILTDNSGLDGTAFKHYLTEELSHCQQFIVIQTPDALQSSRMQVIVDTALQQVQAGHMAGMLRVIAPTLNAVEAQEVPLTWATIPEFDASQDYARALARISLHLGLIDMDQTSVALPPSASYIAPIGPHDLQETSNISPVAHPFHAQRFDAADRPVHPPRYSHVPLRSWLILFSVVIALVLVAGGVVFAFTSTTSTPVKPQPTTDLAANHIPTATPTSTPTPTPTPSPTPTSTPISTPAPVQQIPPPINPPPPPPNQPPAASPITYLGSLNITGYCASIGDHASLDQNNAYGWMCVTPSGTHTPIYTNAACQWQYNQPNILSRMVNYSDPNNWQCYSHVRNLGNINFPQYCQSLGETASLDGNNVYNWHCVASGNHLLIDTDAACRWQYNETDAISSVYNYFDPNGWVCFGRA